MLIFERHLSDLKRLFLFIKHRNRWRFGNLLLASFIPWSRPYDSSTYYLYSACSYFHCQMVFFHLSERWPSHLLPGWGSRNLRSARDLIRPLVQFCRMLKHSLDIHSPNMTTNTTQRYTYICIYIDLQNGETSIIEIKGIGRSEIWKMKSFLLNHSVTMPVVLKDFQFQTMAPLWRSKENFWRHLPCAWVLVVH